MPPPMTAVPTRSTAIRTPRLAEVRGAADPYDWRVSDNREGGWDVLLRRQEGPGDWWRPRDRPGDRPRLRTAGRRRRDRCTEPGRAGWRRPRDRKRRAQGGGASDRHGTYGPGRRHGEQGGS